MGRRLFEWTMHKTVYGQFVGGASLTTLRPCVANLSKSGVHSILDYAVEEDVPDTVVMETRSSDAGQFQPVSREATKEASVPDTVVMETRSSDPGQFQPVSKEATKEASARTYWFVDEVHCEDNKKHFLSCIRTAAEVTEHGRPFAAIKLTGLGRVEFLVMLTLLNKMLLMAYSCV